MRGLIFVLFLAGTLCLAASDSPEGTWETQWNSRGSDRATSYLTFSNDFTWTGYGISLKSLGPFSIVGTWSTDSDGNIVGGYTQYLPAGDEAGVVVFDAGNRTFRGRVDGIHGNFRLRGVPMKPTLHVEGDWVAQVQSRGNKTFESYTIAASTNLPGWFDITGTGIGDNGSFTISGALVVTSDRRANGYTISDLGVSGTTTSSFLGRISVPKGRAVFHGQTDTGNEVTIKATKQ